MWYTPRGAVMGQKEKHNRDVDKKQNGDNDILSFFVFIQIFSVLYTSVCPTKNVTIQNSENP